MVSTIDEARTPAELAEWLRVWADGYEEGVDFLDDNDARQLADAVERVCTNGNARALHDALTAFVDSIQWICEGDESGRIRKQFAVLLSEARAAIASPARNCDVGTAEEQAHRFHAFCSDNTSEIEGMCNSTCPCIDCGDKCHCLCVWSQMPFAPAEGGAE